MRVLFGFVAIDVVELFDVEPKVTSHVEGERVEAFDYSVNAVVAFAITF